VSACFVWVGARGSFVRVRACTVCVGACFVSPFMCGVRVSACFVWVGARGSLVCVRACTVCVIACFFSPSFYVGCS